MALNLNSLGLATPPPAPNLKPHRVATLTPEMARRLLLNQLLVSMLESNTTVMLQEGVWPSKEDKLMTALGHRVSELYERYFERNSPAEVDWLNPIIGLSEGAAISILALAVEANPIKVVRLGALLTQVAQLAGTYQEEEA